VIRAVSETVGTRAFADELWVDATMSLPRNASAVVILAHHEAEAHTSLVRRQIAEHLTTHRLACCTVCLTRPEEHFNGRMILDVESLADRLQAVAQHLANCKELRGLPVAVFGEDRCAAAALIVAASGQPMIQAAGAYCGRPDLARFILPRVEVPTLLVVPGRDPDLLDHNERAFRELACPSQIAVIGNATRSLRETGALQACRYLIRRWCQHHTALDRRAPHQPGAR
jgi:putative phosphoribosyl transferase